MSGTVWRTIKGKRVKINVIGKKKYYFDDQSGQRLTSKGKIYTKGMSRYTDQDREDINDVCYDVHGKSFEELTEIQQKGALKTFNNLKK